MDGIGAGLGAMAFWLFIASVIVAGIWYSIREKDAQHETFRRIVESGQPVDQELVDRVLGSDKQVDRDLKIAGLIVVFTAPGLAVMGWFISLLSPGWLMPMLGVAALVAFVGAGLLAAARHVENSSKDNVAPGGNSLVD